MAMDSATLAALAAQDQGPTILGVCWFLVIFPGLIVALRIWCKTVLSRRGFGVDDMIILLAWSLLLIYTVLITRAVNMGVLGKHVATIEHTQNIPGALKMMYIGLTMLILGCVWSKTSFAFTLLRIVTKTWMKALLWFIIITMNTVMILCAICYMAQCRPAAALWNTALMATAKCWPTSVFETIALVAGAYSGCMDFILALLPWLILWNLEMKKREKIGIALAMSMGVFAAITAFIKTSKLVNLVHVQDFTYFCSSILIWGSAETGLTIFAASLPALRILMVRIRSSYQASEEIEGTYPLSTKSGIETTQEVTVERHTSHTSEERAHSGEEAR
ncbi:hypothetical protein N7490_010962 [Penicillium lividum]|nr:hypothetical protein N7490_010962 [Penicillium lividum]